MLNAKRITKLAEKYGFFVRFFPEGSEVSTPDPEPDGEPEPDAEPKPDPEPDADGKPKAEETVPMKRFQEMVDKVEALTKQAEANAEQQAIAKANPIAAQAQTVDQFDIFKEVGLNDGDDVPNVDQTKKIMAHYGKVFDMRIATLAFHQAHPDYDQLVGTVDEIASGKYAEPLAAAINKNPALQSMIASSKNPRIAAYEVAKLQKESVKTPVVTKDAKDAIDEAVKAAEKVKSPSNTKGGEALSEEGRYKKMSDGDFLRLHAHPNGAFV